MRKVILGGGLAGLLLALVIVACSSNKGFNTGGNIFSNIFCTPDGLFDVTGLLDLDAAAVVLDNAGDAVSDQPVGIEFGSAVTAANLGDGTTLSTSGDSGTSDSTGDIAVEVDCSEVGNDANPCSVTFSTTVDAVSTSCSSIFF